MKKSTQATLRKTQWCRSRRYGFLATGRKFSTTTKLRRKHREIFKVNTGHSERKKLINNEKLLLHKALC